jgi:hypothetical protein
MKMKAISGALFVFLVALSGAVRLCAQQPACRDQRDDPPQPTITFSLPASLQLPEYTLPDGWSVVAACDELVGKVDERAEFIAHYVAVTTWEPAARATPAPPAPDSPALAYEYGQVEFVTYYVALTTSDLAARAAAFDAFANRFLQSEYRSEALQQALEARIRRNYRGEAVSSQAASPSPAPAKGEPTPQERACRLVNEADHSILDLMIPDLEFVLQYRDSDAPCNQDGAERIWRAIQNAQKYAKGEPVGIKLAVQVLSATDRSIDAAITDANQKVQKADLHITMETPMANPPAPGAMVDVIGIISDYTPQPFMFIMTHATLPVPKRSEVRRRAR